MITPPSVRRAGLLVGLQGALGVIAAIVFAVRGLFGADQKIVSGYGNAAWFGLIGAAVLAAGWALWTGRRWGRGLAVFAQLLLLPVAWYIGVGSHRWGYAVPVAAVAIVVLALLFSPSTIQWVTSSDANADNAGPESR